MARDQQRRGHARVTLMETLRQKQSRFARSVPLLLQYMTARGYEYTIGEVWRTQAQAAANADSGAGISNSLHLDRLAIDINLFWDGIYLNDSESHRPFGEFWKSLGDDFCWGGDFKPKQDGNHYSIAHGGRK
jgi:hypothetical protein